MTTQDKIKADYEDHMQYLIIVRSEINRYRGKVPLESLRLLEFQEKQILNYLIKLALQNPIIFQITNHE